MGFQKVHRDANHIQIVKDLTKRGYKVIDLAAVGKSVPDILVASATAIALIEIKVDDANTQFYLSQLEFLATWPHVAGFAETTQDCIDLLEDPSTFGLNYDKRSIILQIVTNERKDTTAIRPRITVRKFEKMFAEYLERRK